MSQQQGAEFVLSATDKTEAAFRAATNRLQQMEAMAARADQAFGGLGSKLLALASVGAVASGFGSIVAQLAALDDAAESTGASVEKLSGAMAVLKPAGIGLDQLVDASTKLVRAMTSADEETSQANEAFKKLGVATRDASGALRDPVDLLKELGEKLNTYRDGADKTALAQALLGKSGAQYLPMLKELGEAGQLNGKVTAEQAAQAEKLEKQWKQLTTSGNQLKQVIASSIIPAMNNLIEQFVVGKEAAGGFWSAMWRFGIKQAPGEDPVAAVTRDMEKIADLQKKIKTDQALVENPGRGGGIGSIAARAAAARVAANEADIKVLEGNLKYNRLLISQRNLLSDGINPSAPGEAKPAAPRLSTKTAGAGGEGAKSFLDKELERIGNLIAQQRLLAESTETVTQADKELARVMEEISRSTEKGNPRKLAAYKIDVDRLRALEKWNSLQDGLKKAMEEQARQAEAALKAEEALRDASAKSVLDAQQRIEEIGKEGAALAILRAQRLAAAEALVRKDASSFEGEGLANQARVMRERADLLRRQQGQGFVEGAAQLEADLKRRREELEVYGMAEEAIMRVRNARIDEQLAALAAQRAREAEKEGNEEVIASLDRYAEALKKSQDLNTREAAMKKLIDQQREWNSTIRQGIEDMIFSGQKAGDVIKQLLIELAKLEFRRSVLDPISSGKKTGSDGSFLGSIFGSILGKGGATPNFSDMTDLVLTASPFANGGVMTSRGPLPLHMYSSGGIATSPQVAVFGEGRSPEAFVPLPNGRSIPVQMRGAGGGSVVINQTINAAPGTSAADLRAAMLVAKNEALSELSNQLRRGGPLRDQVRSVA
jgi:hypothetical protein